MLRLLRLSFSKIGFQGRSAPSMRANVRAGSPIPGGSIFTTSAPQSASTPPAAGPAPHTPISTTFTPAIGPGIAPSCHPSIHARVGAVQVTPSPIESALTPSAAQRTLTGLPGRPASRNPPAQKRFSPYARKRRKPQERRRDPAPAREPQDRARRGARRQRHDGLRRRRAVHPGGPRGDLPGAQQVEGGRGPRRGDPPGALAHGGLAR